MAITEDNVSVTIPLPRHIFEMASDSALRAHKPLEQRLAGLVASGLFSEMTLQEVLDEAHESYLSRMKKQGRQPYTPEEMWDQMRRIREEVADELDTQ